MYGFDQIEDDTLFVGSELLQICIGAHEIILKFFPEGNSITIFDVERFISDNSFLFESLIDQDRRIRQIGQKVSKLSIVSNESASLIMSDGSVILLRDDSSEFEAVTFQCGERIVIV